MQGENETARKYTAIALYCACERMLTISPFKCDDLKKKKDVLKRRCNLPCGKCT